MGLSVGGMTATFAAEIARKVDGVIATTLLDMGDPETFEKTARWQWPGSYRLGTIDNQIHRFLINVSKARN
jgi:hypothetical protein